METIFILYLNMKKFNEFEIQVNNILFEHN